MLRLYVLGLVIKLLDLLLADLPQLLSFETFEYCCSLLFAKLVTGETSIWHDLLEHQKQYILNHFVLLSVDLHECAAVSRLNLVLAEYFA